MNPIPRYPLWAALLACALAAGCASAPATSKPTARLPHNVYREAGRLPAHLKRVAVLPLAAPGEQVALADGCRALEPVWSAALLQSARCEFVAVGPTDCRAWTGRSSWTGSDPLPVDFLDRIRQGTGCDGVLVTQLTHFRAHPPVAVGWRAQLVEVETRRVWWAVDEVFDGGNREVAQAARDFYKARFGTGPGADPDSILVSPRRFGEFTAAVLAGSLPPR